MQNPRAINHEWAIKLKKLQVLGKFYNVFNIRGPQTNIYSFDCIHRARKFVSCNNPSLWKIYFTRRYLCDNVNNFVNVTIYGDVIAFYTQSNRIYIASILAWHDA